MRSITLLSVTVLLFVFSCDSISAKKKLAAGSKCVYLKNVKFGEYLYNELPTEAASKNSIRVFTWRPKEIDGHPKTWRDDFKYQAVWLFEKKASHCVDCFTIKSAFYRDAGPLYSVSNTDPTYKDPKRRPVYTYNTRKGLPAQKGIDIWEVENVPGFLGHIRIKNLYDGALWGEYLYAVVDSLAFDQERRSVYTWSTDEDSNIDTWGGAGDWIIEDAVCPPYDLF